MIIRAKNPYDLKDFISSFDKAIKIRLNQEGFTDSKFIPKVSLGLDKTFQQNELQSIYERPFIEILISKRAPASLTDKDFFTGMSQHRPYFSSEENSEGVTNKVLYRDNEIKLIIRTKTKNELYTLVQVIERMLMFESKLFTNCVVVRYINFKDKSELCYSLFEGEITLRARTMITYTETDNAIMNSYTITYQDELCSYFDLLSGKCTYSDKHDGELAEKENEANDISCYKSDFCKNHKFKNKFEINSEVKR